MKKLLRVILMISGLGFGLYGAQHLAHIVSGFLLELMGTEVNPSHIWFWVLGMILYLGSSLVSE